MNENKNSTLQSLLRKLSIRKIIIIALIDVLMINIILASLQGVHTYITFPDASINNFIINITGLIISAILFTYITLWLICSIIFKAKHSKLKKHFIKFYLLLSFEIRVYQEYCGKIPSYQIDVNKEYDDIYKNRW
ncbi:hypothetical protein [Mycoplasma seminis]|uniref:RDD domain-containing protein n=1 Tax=Mycoplasma seminis TaxID=512749 RepID=A0ABY9HAP2_9MOLU|nr:hypothetical protein [Mycoplasma seminis]WLP85673.1 hypothetical protein Q8852_00745 [Mycoplasma seminis]